MKNYHLRKWILAGLLSIILLAVNAQPLDWNTQGNQISGSEWFGATSTSTIPLEIQHRANYPINIRTNNTLRARFTTGGAFGAGATQGDGLRFFDPSGGIGNLDLWTSSSQQTHIRWDGSGIIQGINNRFEMCSFINGLWFNVTYTPCVFNAQHPPAA